MSNGAHDVLVLSAGTNTEVGVMVTRYTGQGKEEIDIRYPEFLMDYMGLKGYWDLADHKTVL